MSNSPLVDYTRISPNKNSPRNHKIDTITIHCVVGQCTVETLGNIFAPTSRQASSNYGVGTDGKIGMYVEEKDRSWCSSNAANDNRAVTIEVASDTKHPYAVNDRAFAALLDLVTDICKRNGIKKLVWSTKKADRVNHKNGCNMTVHRDYANKSCPGDYLYNRHGEIAAEVNRRLGVADTAPDAGAAQGVTVYTVKKGDTLSRIAAKYGTTYQAIAAYNGIKNPNAIRVGQKIKIPASTAPAALKKGDRVKVLNAVTYDGKPFRTYYDTYDVIQVSGARVVIGVGATVTAAVNAANLREVNRRLGVADTAPDAGAAQGVTVYTVKKGDTLSRIAAKYGTTYQAIAAYNGIKNPNAIRVGQKIKIPASTAPAALKKGDRVKVLNAVTYDGKPFRTYYDTYDVIQVSGARVVIGVGATVTAAVNAANLRKV